MKFEPISLSEIGFNTDGKSIDWDEIIEIVAFKLDLVTVDEVRFAFRINSATGDTWIEVSEEQQGFDELVDELESRFSTVVGWREKVIQPAFEENRTVLYVSRE